MVTRVTGADLGGHRWKRQACAARNEVPSTFRTVAQLRLGRLEREGFAASEEELLP